MTLVPAVLPGRPVRNGLPEFRPYVYRGTGADVLTPHLGDPWTEAQPASVPERCYCDGSMYAYRQHLAKGERPCQASRDDVNLYERSRIKRKAHLRASDGKPRCGGRGTLMTAVRAEVTCSTCLGLMTAIGARP
jgi:hypothetical protein